jgi:hypothetical protein
MFAGCYPLIIPSDQAELSDQSAAFHTSHPEAGKFFFALQGIIQILQKLALARGLAIFSTSLQFSLPVMVIVKTDGLTVPRLSRAAAWRAALPLGSGVGVEGQWPPTNRRSDAPANSESCGPIIVQRSAL